jgi:two-component sensor histidine kinase
MAVAPKLTIPSIFDPASSSCRTLVRVLCSPGSDSLDSTHQFLDRYAHTRFRPQIAERLSVTVYELLSNALNYSSMTEEVTIEILEMPETAAVRIANETIGPRIGMLNEHMNKIKTNAETIMAEEMRRSVGGASIRPMLGLARVVHEASMHLEAAVEGRRVTMTASCRK